MRHKRRLVGLIFLLIVTLMMAGCGVSTITTPPAPSNHEDSSQKEIPPSDQFSSISKVASAYLASGSVEALTPEQLYQKVILGNDPQYILVDIRSNADFVKSNIYGSLNIPYQQTASSKKLAQLPKDKTLVVIDYNGHWAAQTAATWNLLGYQAVPLLYGLQGWSQDITALGYEPFPTAPVDYPLVTAEGILATSALPEVMCAAESVDECIRMLAATYLDRNYKGLIAAEDLLASIDAGENNHYLVDVRDPEHYKLGHIAGAVNIPLKQLADAEMLQHLPQDKKIVLIGYDGLDASQGVRVLVTLNYDAVALKYGMSYWNGDQQLTGITPIQSLVSEDYELVPLNYVQPSTGAASCG